MDASDARTGGLGSGVAEAALEAGVGEAELLEFLVSDLDPASADPVFRERLREELWEMIVEEGVVRPKH